MISTPEFQSFTKIARLNRECAITEKIDGTNGQILITEDNQLFVGSRNKWLFGPDGMTGPDNHGFAQWVVSHKDELIAGLGIGCHFGEWWGQAIGRKYGLTEKRFSLFNTSIWADDAVRPKCCHVVPVLYKGLFNTGAVQGALLQLSQKGSVAAPGFMKPEGVVVYHAAASLYFKVTVEGDEKPKGMQNEV